MPQAPQKHRTERDTLSTGSYVGEKRRGKRKAGEHSTRGMESGQYRRHELGLGDLND